MKFNDNIMSELQGFAVYNQGVSAYRRNSLKESDYENRLPLASKLMKKSPSNLTLLRGKENQCLNSFTQNNKNAVTHHSFNAFFNENTQKMKKKVNESINKKIEFSKALQQSSQMNNQCMKNTFESSGKLSNFQFINQSESHSSFSQIHDQVKSFIKKYFSDCQQLPNLSQQYVSIHDFVDILFEEFQNLIGKHSSVDLIEEFTDKVFLIFGESIYFGELFDKTSQNGLTGLIFEIVKAINQDKNVTWEDTQQKSQQRPINKNNNQPLKQTISVSPKNITSSNVNLYNNQNKNSQILIKSHINNEFQNSKINRSSTTQKISLNKFFGNSTSKIQFNDQSKVFFDESTIFLDENLQEVKKILSDYVESMYEQAEMKLNKKYSQQMRKITLKHKETQRLLQKINEKISSHYDTIELQKQYDRKLKQMTQRQVDLQNKLKNIQFQLKQSKDQQQKQKMSYLKLDQQFTKLKQKLQKYENAIFQKAMQKDSLTNNNNNVGNSNSNSRINQITTASSTTNSSIYSHQLQQQQQSPKFQVKIDTFMQHSNRPVIAPLTHHHHYNQSPSYSPYLTRQNNNNTIIDGSMTPTRTPQTNSRITISPIKQRISFVKTQNPSSLSNNNNNLHPKSSTSSTTSQVINNDNSRISYSPALSKVNNLELNKVQIGERISLRPLSPINKFVNNDIQHTLSVSKVNSVSSSRLQPTENNLSQVKYQTSHNVYQHSQHQQQHNNVSYSPIKVQFCTSQVGALNVPNNNNK